MFSLTSLLAQRDAGIGRWRLLAAASPRLAAWAAAVGSAPAFSAWAAGRVQTRWMIPGCQRHRNTDDPVSGMHDRILRVVRDERLKVGQAAHIRQGHGSVPAPDGDVPLAAEADAQDS